MRKPDLYLDLNTVTSMDGFIAGEEDRNIGEWLPWNEEMLPLEADPA